MKLARLKPVLFTVEEKTAEGPEEDRLIFSYQGDRTDIRGMQGISFECPQGCCQTLHIMVYFKDKGVPKSLKGELHTKVTGTCIKNMCLTRVSCKACGWVGEIDQGRVYTKKNTVLASIENFFNFVLLWAGTSTILWYVWKSFASELHVPKLSWGVFAVGLIMLYSVGAFLKNTLNRPEKWRHA